MGLRWAGATHVAGERATEASASMVSGMAHLVARLGPHEDLRTLVVAQQATHPIDGWLTLGDTRAKDRMGLAHVTWERSDPDRFGLRVTGGYQRALLDAAPATALPSIDSVLDGDVLPLLLQPAGTASSFRGEFALSSRSSSQDRHRWQIGATVDRHGMQPRLLAAPGAVETVNGQAARVWVFDTPAASPTWHQHAASVYARDEMQVGSRLRLDGSIRFESLHASNGSAGSIAWHNIYPRAFATLAMVRDAGLSVFGGVSQSGGPIPTLALGFGDPLSPSGRVYRWTDTNLDGDAQPAEYGLLVARIGPGAWTSGATAIDADLRRPLYTEALLGVAVDRERWSAALTALFRRQTNRLSVADDGATYTRIGVPDQGLSYPFPPTGVLDTYSRDPATFGLDSIGSHIQTGGLRSSTASMRRCRCDRNMPCLRSAGRLRARSRRCQAVGSASPRTIRACSTSRQTPTPWSMRWAGRSSIAVTPARSPWSSICPGPRRSARDPLPGRSTLFAVGGCQRPEPGPGADPSLSAWPNAIHVCRHRGRALPEELRHGRSRRRRLCRRVQPFQHRTGSRRARLDLTDVSEHLGRGTATERQNGDQAAVLSRVGGRRESCAWRSLAHQGRCPLRFAGPEPTAHPPGPGRARAGG